MNEVELEPGINLPSSWAATTVSQVGAVRLGRHRSPAKQTGRFATKYLRTANITPYGLDLNDILEMDFTPSERAVFGLRAGDIVLADSSGSPAHVGRAALWSDEIPDCCFQNHVIRFRPHAVLPDYALQVFRYFVLAGVFVRLARGIGIVHLGASRFSQLPFPLPPLSEQRRISEEVTARRAKLHDAEASLRSALRWIEEQNLVILSSAVSGNLVDSEARIATPDGRAFEGAKALLSSGLSQDPRRVSLLSDTLLSDSFEQTMEIPLNPPCEIPTGWTWARVDQVGKVMLGRMREPKRHLGPHMRPYLRVANVYEDRIVSTDVLEMDFTPAEFEKYSLRIGDILLNEGQSPELVGRPAMYRGEVPGACFQNTLLRFRAGPTLDPDYALIVFRHYLHAGEFRKAARWSTNLAHLSQRRFAAMPFPLPPLAEQRRIAAEARRRLQASAAQEASIRSALDRLPEVEVELLSAAVFGSLVPQHDNDEPAVKLLARLGPPPVDEIARDEGELDPRMESSQMNSQSTDENGSTAKLVEVLREANRPMSLPELFSMAGYDRDSIGDVEQFYLAIRTELDRTIRTVGTAKENVEVEAIGDAAR